MIRPYDAARDYLRVLAMLDAFLQSSELYRSFGEASLPRVQRVIDLALRQGVILVADEDGRAVGFIGALVCEQMWSGAKALEELVWWVDPTARSRRLGPHLLRSLEDWARQEGVSMVKMVAPAGSTVGRFYLKRGYEEVETAFLKRV